jgi:hypothetical protein
MVYPCFTFKKYTGTSKFTCQALYNLMEKYAAQKVGVLSGCPEFCINI